MKVLWFLRRTKKCRRIVSCFIDKRKDSINLIGEIELSASGRSCAHLVVEVKVKLQKILYNNKISPNFYVIRVRRVDKRMAVGGRVEEEKAEWKLNTFSLDMKVANGVNTIHINKAHVCLCSVHTVCPICSKSGMVVRGSAGSAGSAKHIACYAHASSVYFSVKFIKFRIRFKYIPNKMCLYHSVCVSEWVCAAHVRVKVILSSWWYVFTLYFHCYSLMKLEYSSVHKASHFASSRLCRSPTLSTSVQTMWDRDGPNKCIKSNAI